jgi:hypothetical protein
MERMNCILNHVLRHIEDTEEKRHGILRLPHVTTGHFPTSFHNTCYSATAALGLGPGTFPVVCV